MMSFLLERLAALDVLLAWLRRPAVKSMLLTCGALFLLAHSWMFASISVPNERSRIYLSVAIVDQQTLAIDAPIKRFGRIYDWARHDGRAYTDKAPGSSFLGALPYAIVRLFSQPEDWPIERLINLMRTWVMLPLGLIGFLVMRRVLYLCFDDKELADLGAVAWILGTSAFHYSTAFYGHQIVGVMLLLSLWQLLEAEARGGELWRFGLAGLFAGLAGLTEYQAGVPCVLLTLYVIASPKRSLATFGAFALGALPSVAALALYNTYAFGGPLELSYHHLVVKDLATLHKEGVGGVAMPRAELISPVLFSLHRGLWATSPIFLLGVPGALLMVWRGNRRVGLLSLITGAFFFLLVVSTRAWFGGWSFGPRLMVPGFSFMIIGAFAPMAMARASISVEVITRACVVAGVLYQQVVHLVLPEMSPNIKNPLLDLTLPALERGLFAPNIISGAAGGGGAWALLPVASVILVWCLWCSVPRRHRLEERGGNARRADFTVAVSAAAWVGVAVLALAVLWSGPSLSDRRIDAGVKSLEKWRAMDVEIDARSKRQ